MTDNNDMTWPPIKTRNPRKFSSDDMAAGKALEIAQNRPRTRGDCECGPRPCPWVGCRYHLALDIHNGAGFQTTAQPFWSMPATCALDVADIGGRSFEEVGLLIGVTKQRIKQIEESALQKLKGAKRLLTAIEA